LFHGIGRGPVVERLVSEIFLRARAERPGAAPVGFGECRAVVLPATTSSR
jgi:hypothetical protein